MGGGQLLLCWHVKSEYSLLGAVPVVGDRRYTMVEVLMVVLEDHSKLDETLRVDLPPVGIWNLYISDESNSDWDCLA